VDIRCSDCGEEILGSGVVVKEAEPDASDPMMWGNLSMYEATEGSLALFHPNCFKVFQDELLRQERAAVLLVGFDKVEDIREALGIP
jgi:hypothetical protein